MSAAPDIMTSSTSSLQGLRKSSGLRNQTSQNWFTFEDESADNTEGRAESAAREKEREERVRRIRDAQEEERRRKLEELKQHAQQAQKFREQQEEGRRRHIDELRSKDMDRRMAVEERRRDIEKSEQGRREAILARNKERESRLETQRRSSRGNIEFAFGSSAPRLVEPRVDSASGYWGSRRSTSTNNVGRSSGQGYDKQSQEREPTDLRSKRTASAQGLDRSNEGLSRENSSSSRPGSALSASHRNTVGGVRLRPGSAGGRRQRPLSIATTGMTASMYEERQRPTPTSTPSHTRGKGAGTPKPDRLKRARSVTSDTGGLDDDNRSTASSQSVGPSRTPNRRTPSQVKAEAAARKAKTPVPAAARSQQPSTPKSSLGGRKEAAEKKEETKSRKTPSPAVSQDLGEAAGGETNGRQSTPDILRDNNTKRPQTELEQEKAEEAAKEEEKEAEEKQEDTVKETSPLPVPKEATPEVASKEGSQEVEELPNNEEVREKKIITSEEEAKARIAEKRREMKEQKEREAEAERLRLEEERRQEEEQRRKEEEEMKQMERLAEEGRRAEEERIQKAIQEREEEERKAKEEEERLKKEKEETEKKTKEEAEKREAELQEERLKKEEERLARKKRIEEIMARTRGKTAAPAAKEEPAPSSPSPPQQPASLDPLGDPTKPDLLGDISDKVEAENAKNLATPAPAEPELEKGALDSLSLKSEDTENSSPLITMKNGNSMPIKKSNGVVEGGSFDQILDLGDLGDSNKEERSQGMPSPMRAFEETSQQGGGGALEVADLLS